MSTEQKILVTGGTGFVGNRLRSALVARGNAVSIATRSPQMQLAPNALVEYVPWLPDLSKFDAVVNLAGEPIMGRRWNEKFKARILSSRVEGTHKLFDAIAAAEKKPSVLVSASAVGFYGDQGERALTESSAHGSDFMALVCEQWEREAQRAAQFGVRVVNLRIGVALGREGGALAKMLPPFRLGLGGPFGSGAMYMSWIHVQDLVELIAFAIRSQSVSGPLNGVAPGACTNKQFSKALGRALHRPAIFPVPPFALRLVVGQVSQVLLASQHVKPERALAAGFRFKFPEIDGALRDLVG
jgi:uncharacterized protein (TIGR01777 family)